jgi:ribonuclease VapC
MFLDASAMIAMMTNEADAAELSARMERRKERFTSPIAVFETAAGVARILGIKPKEAYTAVTEWLHVMNVRLLDLPAQSAELALDAFARYGKGQGQSARLNLGDCFAYACARHYRAPLLYKGDDFTRTDIDPA